MQNKTDKTKASNPPGLQLLRDPAIPPTDEVLAAALGGAFAAYTAFVGALPNHDILMHWHYYTDVRAWLAKGATVWKGPRGGHKEATVFWLSAWQGFFKATFFIPEKSCAKAANLPMDDTLKQMLADFLQTEKKLKNFPLVFDVFSDEKLEALFAAADFKKNISVAAAP